MFTSLSAAVSYVRTNKLFPLYLLTDDAKQEFVAPEQHEGTEQNAVVVGLAPEAFNYDRMNEAFRFVHRYHHFTQENRIMCKCSTALNLLQNFNEIEE